MATRPTWQGYLRLSLVSCPVALYTATSRSADVSFNMLHKQTHNRIRMIPTDPETGPVERADIVKGYEIEKGLIEGTIKPRDVPDEWHGRMTEYLGLSTRDKEVDEQIVTGAPASSSATSACCGPLGVTE